MPGRDRSSATAAAFGRNARLYAQKYFDLTDYDRFYARLLETVPPGGKMIDVACGPGNVSAHVSRTRPDVAITGVDLAPDMIAEARARVPAATFLVADCRDLGSLPGPFDAAAFCFGLSYLDDAGAAQALQGLRDRLCEGGALLLATITGETARECVETSSGGDEFFVVYRVPDQILDLLSRHGFEVRESEILDSPASAGQKTRDLVVLAVRRGGG